MSTTHAQTVIAAELDALLTSILDRAFKMKCEKIEKKKPHSTYINV